MSITNLDLLKQSAMTMLWEENTGQDYAYNTDNYSDRGIFVLKIPGNTVKCVKIGGIYATSDWLKADCYDLKDLITYHVHSYRFYTGYDWNLSTDQWGFGSGISIFKKFDI